MNKLPKEKRDKLLLVVIGTAVLLAALYFLVINAQRSALNEYGEKTEAAKEKLAKAERWLRMAAGVQARLNANEKELEVRHEGMAPTDKFKWFYDTLEHFMAQRRVRLTDITREPEIGDVGILPKFPYQAATFGVKLRARYRDFGTFLADFENQYPFMRVKNLEMEPESTMVFKDAPNPTGQVDPESLFITMRVVTLIKPNVTLASLP